MSEDGSTSSDHTCLQAVDPIESNLSDPPSSSTDGDTGTSASADPPSPSAHFSRYSHDCLDEELPRSPLVSDYDDEDAFASAPATHSSIFCDSAEEEDVNTPLESSNNQDSSQNEENSFECPITPLLESSTDEILCESEEEDNTEGHGVHSRVDLAAEKLRSLKFPHPSQFESKEEFDQACHKWKRQVQSVMDTVILPVPAVSFFYRPKPPTHLVGGRLNGRFIYNIGSLPASGMNYRMVLERLYDGAEFDGEEMFPEQGHNTRTMYIKDQIVKEDQWQAQLFPAEPMPAAFDDYEEYEQAYKEWREEATKCMRIGIKHPRRLKYRVVREKSRKVGIPVLVSMSSYSKLVWNTESGSLLPSDVNKFDWTQGMKAPKRLQRIERKLRQLYRQSVKIEKPKGEEWVEHLHVVGVEKRDFIDDFCRYGVDVLSLTSMRPVGPRVIRLSCGVKSEEELVRLREKIEDIPLDALEKLVPRLNDVETFLLYRPKLISVMNDTFLDYLCECEQVNLLYEFVLCFVNFNKDTMNLIKPPRGACDGMILKLVHVHYLSVLLECIGDVPEASLTRATISRLRELSLSIREFLEGRSSLRTELWDSLESDESSDLATVMFMTACLPSTRLKYLFVFPEFLTRASCVSTYRNGRTYILLLLFHDNGDLLHTICEYPNTELSSFLVSLPDSLVYLLSDMVLNYSHWLTSSKLTLNHHPLLNLALEAAKLGVLKFHAFLSEAGKILCQRSRVIGFESPDYQETLVRVTCYLAEAVTQVETGLPIVLRTVIPWLQAAQCSQQFAEYPNCMSVIAKHLSSEDHQILCPAWKCIRKLCVLPSNAMIVLASPDFASAIGTCYNSTDAVVTRKALSFTIRRFRSTTEVRSMMCDVLIRCVGVVSCLVAANRFSSAPRALAALEEFVLWIDQNQDWQISKLLMQHMGANVQAFYDRVPKRLSY